MCIRDSYSKGDKSVGEVRERILSSVGTIPLIAVSYTHLDVYKRQLKWQTVQSALRMARLFREVSDMHANRNKKAVKRVEKGMMKANRIRNLFAVFAIVLTTFMITTVFSLGINYMGHSDIGVTSVSYTHLNKGGSFSIPYLP